ncbi:hypothetical protein OSB04_028406 [Centaurea solstitialis]|uniref:Uncharacterized protein n=1 Tax=Centaurea solstitialis TaxID=347529 RepID=A0AA38ST50_9ASTR|nr:hypothetical protein OSB04_028406 [Centaurea solstitialis]
MGESLTEQCRVEVEGPRVMNFFSRRRSNDVDTKSEVRGRFGCTADATAAARCTFFDDGIVAAVEDVGLLGFMP